MGKIWVLHDTEQEVIYPATEFIAAEVDYETFQLLVPTPDEKTVRKVLLKTARRKFPILQLLEEMDFRN
jgi:hypothetical protein